MNEQQTLGARALVRARRAIGQAYPQVRRVTPTVSPRPDGTFHLTFQRTVPLPKGGTLREILRVTVDEQGEVLRVMASK